MLWGSEPDMSSCISHGPSEPPVFVGLKEAVWGYAQQMHKVRHTSYATQFPVLLQAYSHPSLSLPLRIVLC